jgi:hypothetical protein
MNYDFMLSDLIDCDTFVCDTMQKDDNPDKKNFSSNIVNRIWKLELEYKIQLGNSNMKEFNV